jgi:hypothetical protein
MGRVIFEIGENVFELEKDDVEILRHFQTITGIKAVLKPKVQDLAVSPVQETNKAIDVTGVKPFTNEMMPNKDEIAGYIMDHLDGFNIPMVLEHFYGEIPRYGISADQDRLLGKFTGRVKRAREIIENSDQGKFVLETKGMADYYVFKKNVVSPTEIPEATTESKKDNGTDLSNTLDAFSNEIIHAE